MPICRIYDSLGKELAQCSTAAFPPHAKISFGRSSQCDICLKSVAETSISRNHFYIQEGIGGQWTIYDNGSRAGLIQNAKKIKTAPLVDGAIFRFGGLFFAFGEKGVPSHYQLKWVGSDGKEHTGTLWEGTNSVGASRDNYVTVREGDISRFHAHLIIRGKSVLLESVNSILETEVNGQRIDGAVELHPGDILSLAGYSIELEYLDIAEKRAPVLLSQQEVSFRNQRMRTTRNTSRIVACCLLGTAILCLVALGVMAMKWLPGAQ